jgi:hypothetical protein
MTAKWKEPQTRKWPNKGAPMRKRKKIVGVLKMKPVISEWLRRAKPKSKQTQREWQESPNVPAAKTAEDAPAILRITAVA